MHENGNASPAERVAEGALDPVGYLDDMRTSGVLDLIGGRSSEPARTPARAR